MNTMAGLFFVNENKRFTTLIAFMLTSIAVAFGQFEVKFIVHPKTNLHPNDTVYLSGNFNVWNPSSVDYQLIRKNDNYFITIKNLQQGAYEYKVTRGTWATVETELNGEPANNRILQLAGDTSIELTVAGWRDDFLRQEKPHTISSHVSLMDSAFEMPELHRQRKIWLYLPEGYADSKKRYPVLYMHDGQNLFDEYTASFGEWGIDEWMDSMVASGKPPCIIVGIENGPERMNEYNPFDNANYGTGEGNQYTDFIVKTLKPYIDKHYKALTGKENTIIAGSSMGGLISYYAMLKYPDVFGKSGVFSPSFWIADNIGPFTDSAAKKATGKFFFYGGGDEGEHFIDDMKTIQEKMGSNSGAMIYSVIDPKGKHNEAAWRKWFGEFYCWIMASGFNRVTTAED